MSSVRVLVGTRKGAFILIRTASGIRGASSGPHFAGWEIYHVKGSPADPNRIYASQSRVGSGSRFNARTTAARRGSRSATSSSTTACPERINGTTARRIRGSSRASGISSRRSPIPTRCTRASKTRRSFGRATAGATGKNSRACASTLRARVAARRRRHVPAYDSPRPQKTRSASSSRSRRPARFAATTPAPPGARSTAACDRAAFPIRGCGSRALRSSHRDASLAPRRALHAEALGRDAQRRRGDSWREVSGNLPTDFGFPIDVHAHEPETIYVVPIKSDSEHFPPDAQAARLSQPHRRQRVGGADERATAARLLRQRAARRDGRRYARLVRHLFRDDRRPSLRLFAGRRATLEYGHRHAIFPRCSRSKSKRCRDSRGAAGASEVARPRQR
jgi:hypothetical protein